MANEIRDAFNTVYADGPTGNPDEPDKYQVREIVGGTIQDQVDEAKALAQGAAEGYVIGTTWTALAAIVGTRAGQPGRVPTSDSGTHTDPVVGGAVSNSGEYAWSVSPGGWRRVGDVIDPSVLAPKNSPVFTGTPVAPTPSATDRSTKIATTENVKTSVETVAIDLPFVAQRAHSFPDAAGVPLAGILDDGRVVGYRRSGGVLVCFGDSITAFPIIQTGSPAASGSRVR